MATLVEVEGIVVSMFEEVENDFPHVHVATPTGCPLIAVGVGSHADWSYGDWDLLTEKQTQSLQKWLDIESTRLEKTWHKIQNGAIWEYPKAARQS